MITARLIPASSLTVGPATIIVRLPDQTIRSRVALLQHESHGVVRVLFASGDLITLMARSTVGCIDARAPRTRRRAS